MATWNYRIVEKVDGDNQWVELHEVYYDSKDRPRAMTARPEMAAETKDDLIGALTLMLKDAKDRPIFVPPARWSE